MQQTAIADGGGGEPSKTDMTAVKAFMQRVHKNPKPVAMTTPMPSQCIFKCNGFPI